VKLKLHWALCVGVLLCVACDRATTGARIPVYDQPQLALVVIDAQQGFLDAGGRLSIARSQVDGLIAATNRLVGGAPSLGVNIAFVTSESPPGGAIDGRIAQGASPVFAKSRADAFSNPELDRFLRSRSIDHLVLAGVFADRCVYYTAVGAMNRGYKVQVVADAIGAASDERREHAIRGLRQEGAEIIDSERVLAEWTRRRRYLSR